MHTIALLSDPPQDSTPKVSNKDSYWQRIRNFIKKIFYTIADTWKQFWHGKPSTALSTVVQKEPLPPPKKRMGVDTSHAATDTPSVTDPARGGGKQVGAVQVSNLQQGPTNTPRAIEPPHDKVVAQQDARTVGKGSRGVMDAATASLGITAKGSDQQAGAVQVSNPQQGPTTNTLRAIESPYSQLIVKLDWFKQIMQEVTKEKYFGHFKDSHSNIYEQYIEGIKYLGTLLLEQDKKSHFPLRHSCGDIKKILHLFVKELWSHLVSAHKSAKTLSEPIEQHLPSHVIQAQIQALAQLISKDPRDPEVSDALPKALMFPYQLPKSLGRCQIGGCTFMQGVLTDLPDRLEEVN